CWRFLACAGAVSGFAFAPSRWQYRNPDLAGAVRIYAGGHWRGGGAASLLGRGAGSRGILRAGHPCAVLVAAGAGCARAALVSCPVARVVRCRPDRTASGGLRAAMAAHAPPASWAVVGAC